MSEGLNWDPVYYPENVLNNALSFNVSHDLRKYQKATLAGMLTPLKILQLSDSGLNGQSPYTLTEFLSDVTQGVFAELDIPKKPDVLRRALHRQFFDVVESNLTVNLSELGQLYQAVGAPTFITEALGSSLESDYKVGLKLALQGLEKKLLAAVESTKDAELKGHWQDCLNQTRRVLAR